MTVTIEPLGHYVIVEALEVETKTASGIVLTTKGEREQKACEFGIVKAIGPLAFIGVSGCDPEKWPPSHANYKKLPHEIWGFAVGDQIEYRRYEGKETGVKDVGNLRYIPDVQIIGKVTGEIKITTASF